MLDAVDPWCVIVRVWKGKNQRANAEVFSIGGPFVASSITRALGDAYLCSAGCALSSSWPRNG